MGHVALLIDADNAAQPNYLRHILQLADYYGELEIRRAYGDWTEELLLPQCEKYDALQIERRQVSRVGKNATDHRLLVEAGEILGDFPLGNEIGVFVIVSGDGDFASACEYMGRRRQVIGIGNRNQASTALRASCEAYYFLEDLEEELKHLEAHYIAPPGEIRAYFIDLCCAYHSLIPQNDWRWVPYSQIEAKLHEIVPDYDSRFGNHTLSEWLGSFAQDYESRDQKVRRIDPNPEYTRRSLLVSAYLQTRRPEGRATLADLGKALHELARDYEEQFGGKKLNKWLEAYPDTFKIRGQYVISNLDWELWDETS